MAKRMVERKQMVDLTNVVLLYLKQVDALLEHEKRIPFDVSKQLGRMSGALELANDQARYFGLGVNYRNDTRKQLKS